MSRNDDDTFNAGLTPAPDGPLPGPLPGPIPGPLPGPIPGPQPGPFPGPIPFPPDPFPVPLPPDWWHCRRLGPVSGRYMGDQTLPIAGRSVLDLRVDIDPRSANSPVMDRVSGDFYTQFKFGHPGLPGFSWRVYRESWIIDSPAVTWSRCQVEITGTLRFWQGSHPATTARIVIPWGTLRPAGPASVTISADGAERVFSCARRSTNFRDITLEVDCVSSVGGGRLLPVYDTSSHPVRPADLPQRVLTVESTYQEAGIGLTIQQAGGAVDDSLPQFSSWNATELHDAMETAYSRFSSAWPSWQMWGLLAGQFANSGVGGIMFDAAGAYGGAGEPPERQGFAVFRNHSWFTNLPAGAPANDTEAEALRKFLYTYVHEAGHAFNFLHSWDKARPDALSWMNYDWKYDNRNGTDAFWSTFRMRFDDEELLHIRHGNRAAVIMGGDPWASGGHLEAPADAMSQLEGQPPLELLVRSRGYFDLMEPIYLELRLRNLLPDQPIGIDARLSPEFGTVLIQIRRPDGRIMEYAPIMCQLGIPDLRVLGPASGIEGEDRYSESVFVGYGQYGFYFADPGEYQVRAIYQGGGDVLIPSNVHRIRIGVPTTREEDQLAGDFFSYEVGMNLYLDGSASPYLAEGRDVLEKVAEKLGHRVVGARAAEALANAVGQPFFRIEGEAVVQAQEGNPQEALQLTDRALEVYRKEDSRHLNIAYHELVTDRAILHVEAGAPEAARQELEKLKKDLKKRGVNEPVLDQIETSAANVEELAATAAR